MLERAVEALEVARDGAWAVGDRLDDLRAARAFGARPVLVLSGAGQATHARIDLRDWPDLLVADDLAQAATRIGST
jgi:phosphoglycolate phosphatase-like HAD superfamily hydrolase